MLILYSKNSFTAVLLVCAMKNVVHRCVSRLGRFFLCFDGETPEKKTFKSRHFFCVDQIEFRKHLGDHEYDR